MKFRGKNVIDINSDDINLLLANNVPESNVLEYKQALPGNTDSDKKEFLADVTSIANTTGGVLIYGISEQQDENGVNTGLPEAIVGFGKVNTDQEKLRLESILQDGISPKISGIILHCIDLQSGESILLLAIPNSYNSPHSVWFKKSGKYFRRHSSGKYQLEPEELRQMFLETGDWVQKVESYVQGRLDRITEGKIIPSLEKENFAVIHILPLGQLHILTDIVNMDLSFTQIFKLRPTPKSWGKRATLDGMLVSEGITSPTAYNLFLRNKGIELYSAGFHRSDDKGPCLNGIGLSEWLTESTFTYLDIVRYHLEASEPFVLSLSIHGVLGRRMHIPSRLDFDETNQFLENNPYFPPIMLEPVDLRKELEEQLKPLINTLWQAAGIEKAIC